MLFFPGEGLSCLRTIDATTEGPRFTRPLSLYCLGLSCSGSCCFESPPKENLPQRTGNTVTMSTIVGGVALQSVVTFTSDTKLTAIARRILVIPMMR
jgi:hypothetical protein